MEPEVRPVRGFQRAAVAVALIGLVAIFALFPEARIPAGAAGSVSLLLLAAGVRRRRRLATANAVPRRRSLWPDTGLKSVVEAMPEPALLVDAALTLRYRNGRCVEAFGEIALGDPIALRFRAPPFLAAAQAAVGGAEARSVDYVERLPVDRSWSVDILPIRDSERETPSFFLFLFRDRTAERRIERMRTDFVANASHELRTPLSSLIGFIETLQGPARNDETSRTRFLEIMRVEAGRMSRLIDDLLSLSRIETKPPLGAGDRADAAEIVTTVAELLAPMAASSDVEITVEGVMAAPVLVGGDRDELVQVVSNLVENGCKYAAGGRRLVLGLRNLTDRSVEIFVTDFGPGIADRHLPRLTERFYRVEEGEGPRTRGTGLGLSIVRNILARHGTRLQVNSSLGKGATFAFRLQRPPSA